MWRHDQASRLSGQGEAFAFIRRDIKRHNMKIFIYLYYIYIYRVYKKM
jgi:hypothetical protein